ncbi:F-actin capping protein alpha subunit [Rhizodiscina lignyota]|uniref:F-actin-capping protein subunit alpha n=1 Tax=Rhizodiscina lignyota TaxID=1504668 RepID=A0A9P4IEU8_9PEZI|nr:F-actin capping protein alpha subunit [Rhizodiscina lignyota]
MGNLETLGSFIESAPPGELPNVTTAIKSIVGDKPLSDLQPAFEKYNEEQFTTVKLPGGSQSVVISPYNKLDDGRYFDVESSTSFVFDHSTQKASNAQSYVLDSSNADLIKSLLKSFKTYVDEHYPDSSIGVYPTDNDSKVAVVLVSSKYSPNNFWGGRYRSSYLLTPSSSSLTGTIYVDVHYYEDGNVRLLTEKSVSPSTSSSSAADIVKTIRQTEQKYQEELNRAFVSMSEGAFKGLRRQLPVTRQKIEWDRVGGYRIGQDIGGAKR